MALDLPNLFDLRSSSGIFKNTRPLQIKSQGLRFLGNQPLGKVVANLRFPDQVVPTTPGAIPEVLDQNTIWFGDDFTGEYAIPGAIQDIQSPFWFGNGATITKNVFKMLLNAGNAFSELQQNTDIQYKFINWWEIQGRFRYANPEETVSMNLGIAGTSDYFKIKTAGKPTEWFLSCEGTGGGSTSGFFTVEENKWHDFRIYWNGTTVRAYINQIHVATSTIDSVNPMSVHFTCVGAGLTSDHTLELDWFSLKYR